MVFRPRSVALVTLGCARNEVDSEELAGRLEADGFTLVDDPDDAETVLVNTCAFVEQAKKDSIDTLLQVSDREGTEDTEGTAGQHRYRPGSDGKTVVAVGCLAERYGDQLAASLPEADAVLGFDDYPEIAARLRQVLAGSPPAPHVPQDRRTLLPLTPVDRQRPPADSPPDLPAGVGPASGPRVVRRRLGSGPVAPVKLAAGCDRRCTFCAIPTFRGAFVSRPPADLLAEAQWLAGQGVREIVLVSENSTSYGKDLGDLRLLESLLAELAAVPGLARVRVSYLQPAEMRTSLLDVMAATPGVLPYFDLSFQHASPSVLRRMRRFGGTGRFLDLVGEIRARAPRAGIRSNVIVGFPGETEEDVAELEGFLTAARLDAVGVFGYSDEEGTEAATYADKLPAQVVDDRVSRLSSLAEQLTAQRAEDRVGEDVEVLVEEIDPETGAIEGRAAHQAPEVDGLTVIDGAGWGHGRSGHPGVGDLVRGKVMRSTGVDLVARCDAAEPEDES